MQRAVLTGLILSTSACALPSLERRIDSVALPESAVAQTRLAQAVTARTALHPGLSGIRALTDAQDAFAARMLLAGVAERSLDVQYYIWHEDTTGLLLLDALRAAADRGVRVRLLLDDNGLPSSLDPRLAALDAHASIEVRLFNPFSVRRPKALGYLTHFSRANRRMHNKSFTVDQQATIVGGRNIGDEYFDATEGMAFADLDVLAIGPVVAETTADFDRYWASASSYPVEDLLPRAAAGDLAVFAQAVAQMRQAPRATRYLDALRRSPLLTELLSGDLALEWAPATMVSDDPAKGLGKAHVNELLIAQFATLLGMPTESVNLVSPYFVPTATGVEVLAGVAARGVKVQVLTNALEATDVAVVHAGYAKRRKALLAAGIELYEKRREGEGERQKNARPGPFGSSGSSLHAKTFSVDHQRVFVGSFNFDPRSTRLNTELGFIIDSPVLALAIDDAFRGSVPLHAYRVQLNPQGRLYWTGQTADGRLENYEEEPGTTIWRRLFVRVMSWLPIEWLL